jgi:hypothetical protein
MPNANPAGGALAGIPVLAPLTGELTAVNGRSDPKWAFTKADGVLKRWR